MLEQKLIKKGWCIKIMAELDQQKQEAKNPVSLINIYCIKAFKRLLIIA
jgi:hypothetical protein